MAITKTKIEVTVNAYNPRWGGQVSGTPLPGTLISLLAATLGASNFKGNLPQVVEASVGADGAYGWNGILLDDAPQGFLPGTAYVSGVQCFWRTPLPGEIYNVRVGEGAGTSNSFNIGDLLMIDSNNGFLIANSGTVPQVAWMAYEPLTQIVADSLLACIRLA